MYWLLLKLAVLSFVPLPINPRIKRPDATKNMWTFECDGFTSCFEASKVFYTDTLAARNLVEEKSE
jgi:hypothetical protein